VELERKLQIKPGTSVAVVAVPLDVHLDLSEDLASVDDPSAADVVLAFVTRASEMDTVAAPALEAARGDRLAWIAYPKGQQLGTDLNRDRLSSLAGERGAQPVRQVSIDEVWSALRFRPA